MNLENSLEEIVNEREIKALSDLSLRITGFDIEKGSELREHVRDTHKEVVEKYGLPSDELRLPGRQQEYVDRILELIDAENVHLEVGKTKGGTPGQYNPEAMYFSSSDKKTYHGIITVDEDLVARRDGNEILPILAHEYIHVRQIKALSEKNEDFDPELDIGNYIEHMEYEAFAGSNIIGDNFNPINFFKVVAESAKAPCFS